jgi:NitT/TauT family transport system substrate-binding protein
MTVLSKTQFLHRSSVLLGALLFAAGVGAQTKLTIGSSVHSLFSLPLYIADSKGLFKEQGLSVEIVNFQGGATATPALLGGSTELQSAGTENMLKVVQQGQPIVSVMSVQSTLNGALILRKEFAAKIGKKPTMADLKGARIGTLARGGMSDMAVRYLLAENGLTERDVALVPILGYDKHGAALAAGEIDGSYGVEPVQTFWTEGNLKAVSMVDMLKGEGPAVFQDMNWITLQGKKDWIDKNRVIVTKVVRAMVQAQKFIANPANLDQVTDLAMKTFPNVPRPILLMSIKNQLHTYAPTITESGIKKNNDLLIMTGNLKTPVPFSQVVDMSYAPIWEEYKTK